MKSNFDDSMLVCGRCHFGAAGTMHSDSRPAASLVLAFSSAQLLGPGGVLEQIENMSEQRHLPKAASYCSVCRKCTWLCSPDADLNEACVHFMHASRTTSSIQDAVRRMHALSTMSSGSVQGTQ